MCVCVVSEVLHPMTPEEVLTHARRAGDGRGIHAPLAGRTSPEAQLTRSVYKDRTSTGISASSAFPTGYNGRERGARASCHARGLTFEFHGDLAARAVDGERDRRIATT